MVVHGAGQARHCQELRSAPRCSHYPYDRDMHRSRRFHVPSRRKSTLGSSVAGLAVGMHRWPGRSVESSSSAPKLHLQRDLRALVDSILRSSATWTIEEAAVRLKAGLSLPRLAEAVFVAGLEVSSQRLVADSHKNMHGVCGAHGTHRLALGGREPMKAGREARRVGRNGLSAAGGQKRPRVAPVFTGTGAPACRPSERRGAAQRLLVAAQLQRKRLDA